MEALPETSKSSKKGNNPSGVAVNIDRDELFKLRVSKELAVPDIAKLLRIGQTTVYDYLKKWEIPSPSALKAFKKTRSDQLADNQRRIQAKVTDKKLTDSNLNQLVMAQAKYYDMERLENDLSTANLAVKQGGIDDMDPETIKVMRKLARLVPEMLDETED